MGNFQLIEKTTHRSNRQADGWSAVCGRAAGSVGSFARTAVSPTCAGVKKGRSRRRATRSWASLTRACASELHGRQGRKLACQMSARQGRHQRAPSCAGDRKYFKLIKLSRPSGSGREGHVGSPNSSGSRVCCVRVACGELCSFFISPSLTSLVTLTSSRAA